MLVALLGFAPAAHATWLDTPLTNLPVCTARQQQLFRNAATDGGGGMIVAWMDLRTDSADIYVQRVTASGTIPWTNDGVLLCGATRDQDLPTITADGTGGAIVAWRDFRSGSPGVLYAQRVNELGEALWANNGVRVCLASGEQTNPTIVSDGFGGAIVAWEDWRSGVAIYGQRLSADGTRRWAANGVKLASVVAAQFEPQAISDGAGGAIVVWSQQSAGGYDLIAQRVDAVATQLWGNAGVAVCAAAGDQLRPQIATDRASGAVFAWEDRRGTNSDIYAQRITQFGLAHWTVGGVPVCTVSGDQVQPAVASDGGGGAIVAWRDLRGLGDNLYAQRVNSVGVAQWTGDGVSVCSAPFTQQFPSIVADGRGGAIVAWEDERSLIALDIYAQRLSASGASLWLPNGMPVSIALGSQYQPFVVPQEDSVTIVTWIDQRTGGSDIFAQRIPFVITVDAPRPLPGASGRLAAAYPNPAIGNATLRFELARPARARLALHDAAGRRVRQLADGAWSSGAHAIAWDGRDDDGRPLPAGVYFVRLDVDGVPAGIQRLTLRR